VDVSGDHCVDGMRRHEVAKVSEILLLLIVVRQTKVEKNSKTRHVNAKNLQKLMKVEPKRDGNRRSSCKV
jgi:hypothetical protein